MEDKQYSGRRPDIVNFNLSLDREAAQILHQHCPPGTKAAGRFVSRLLFEHQARVEERTKSLSPTEAEDEGM